MEPVAQKSLERVISQRALQMSSSFPCKIWVLGFFCGVCITYLFLIALTPYSGAQFGLGYSTSPGAISQNSSSINLEIDGSENCSFLPKDEGRLGNVQTSEELSFEERVLSLYSAWSSVLNETKDIKAEIFSGGLEGTAVPKAPHLQDCKKSVEINKHLDNHGENGSFPPWTLWRGLLGLELLQSSSLTSGGHIQFGHGTKLEGAYPPWVVGSDEDNFPLTRQVQKEIWIHQHPQNCSEPNLRFLVADWERLPGFGIGAQLAGMMGLLAIAINENRILVTSYYNRADHSGCQGSSRSHWSCYFFHETSRECQRRAFDLIRTREAWDKRIVTVKDNYTSKEIWAGRIPRVWGEPWNYLQPTTDIDGSLLMRHRKMDRRWWRAQAIRYLMRFRSEYMCSLLNEARHTSFGLQAAEMVIRSPPASWSKEAVNTSRAEMEQYVWSSYKPWVPSPLLSMHVRMGDKACEMKVVNFENYMQLANRIREHFPNLNNIWLSTEMQEVIDESRLYPHWNFYYTNIRRQVGNTTMATYEESLGRKTSTNYPLVNFLMATEADFFIGALGSTWCYLIDGMRNTGGKVMAGYLSVNRDRFW